MNKLLCNAGILFLGGTLLISNTTKPKFTYEYLIRANSNNVNDMIVMYDVKQDFIKTYDELVLKVNEEYHRETVINNLDKFVNEDLGKCEYLDEKIVITIGEGKGGCIEGFLKNNICDSEVANYRIYIFDLLFGEEED